MRERRTMLIADHVEVNRTTIRAMFENEYDVLETDNGRRVLEILKDNKIDIVILEACIPELDGKEVLHYMRMDRAMRDIPVVAKTLVDEHMEIEMLESGADDFIYSMCEPAVMKRRVKNVAKKYMQCQAAQQRLEEERRLRRMREQFIVHICGEISEHTKEIAAQCESAGEDAVAVPRERLTQINRQAKDVLKIAGSIIEDSKVIREERLLSAVPFQLKSVAVEVAEECNRMCQKKEIGFWMDNEEPVYDNLLGDCRWLKHIWSRLLAHACESTEPHGQILTGYTTRMQGEGQIELEITVQGGIPENGKYEVICSMVELLKGSIRIENGADDKTRCVVTLLFGVGKEPVSQKKNFHSMRALILDDDDVTRDYHLAMVMRLGIACDSVQNGAEAAQMLESAYEQGEGYDICFVNWYMPGGEKIIREMRQKYPPERMIIACSSNEKKWMEQSMLNAGVDYVIEKPVHQSVLYRFLTDYCKEKKKTNTAV